MNKFLQILLGVAAVHVTVGATVLSSIEVYDRYTAHTKQKEALFNSYFNLCAQEVERKGYNGGYPEREILELRKACGVAGMAYASGKADYTVLGRSWTFDKEAQMYVEVFK